MPRSQAPAYVGHLASVDSGLRVALPPTIHLPHPIATGHGELRLSGPEQPRRLMGEGMLFPRNDSKPLPMHFCSSGMLSLPVS